MLIICKSCQQQLNLPDERVPPRPFVLTCPSCKTRQQVDPATDAVATGSRPLGGVGDTGSRPAMKVGDTGSRSATVPGDTAQRTAMAAGDTAQRTAMAAGDTAQRHAMAAGDSRTSPGASEVGSRGLFEEPAEPAPGSRAEAPPLTIGPDGFVAMPALRPPDAQLLASLPREAVIANLTGGPSHQLAAGLQLLGFQPIYHMNDLAVAAEAVAESEISVLLIWLDKASPPPCEPLEPIQNLPAAIRRRTFIVLMAENVRSLDGQVAFFLQLNCVVSAQEIAFMPALLQRALLHHLKLYRHWESTVG